MFIFYITINSVTLQDKQEWEYGIDGNCSKMGTVLDFPWSSGHLTTVDNDPSFKLFTAGEKEHLSSYLIILFYNVNGPSWLPVSR